VPVHHLGEHDLFEEPMQKREFMRSILFIEDIAVIGYVDPRES
jgi:hypothetical protein